MNIMTYKELDKIIDDLTSSVLSLSDFKDKNVGFLRAIGRQLTIKYKFTEDKESQEALRYIEVLVEVRTLVKARLNIRDTLMDRYKEEHS